MLWRYIIYPYTSVPIEAPGASDSDDAPSILDRYADDDNELDFTDDRLVIEEAIRDFSPREREVIELRFVKGMTQIEIAKKLGISQVQVSRLLRRTLKNVTKTYAIQAGRELRVIVGADKIDDKQTENLSGEIAKKIQDEMTYPGQVKITVIRETRAVSFAK